MSLPATIIGRAPQWQDTTRVHWRIPRALRSWLLDDDSLTAKLIALSSGDFRVKLLSQELARPQLSECRALGLPPRQLALVRQVVLLGEGEPWVFARSLVPLSTLTGRLRQLRQLDTRPLGAFLFSQHNLQRGGIAVSRIDRHHQYLPAQVQGNATVWGRRSVFRVDDKPLLVSEVFLPGFYQRLVDKREGLVETLPS